MSVRRAVVIGASVAGLLAARALSETFSEVVVLERHDLPAEPKPRRGVPQSNQLHVLLSRGATILDGFFPGFTDELVASGALRNDPQVDSTYYLDGHPVASRPSGLTLIGVSRALLEFHLRRRVEAAPNVVIRQATATGLQTDQDRTAATGVFVDSGAALDADLVVDASGRGSQAVKWLTGLGFPAPDSTEITVNVVYVTRHYQWEAHHLGGRNGLLCVPYPGKPRGAGVVRVEDNRWELVLFGLFGHNPTTDEQEMRAFARSLPVPQVARLMAEATPLDDAVLMRYPSSVRRHFERQRRHLEGFVVTGDANCSFNPTYGQGMTCGAIEALILRDLARAGTAGLPARFYPQAAKAIDPAWDLAVGGDRRFPEVEGQRSYADRMLNRYLDRYRLASSVDPALGRTFLEVANMEKPATAMVSPGHLLKVWRAARSMTRVAAADAGGSQTS
ncbi:FAD-dependent oxidoreductase [Fodinicola acaciae]|uniref:FAD-dependent oxidoreductase n=1 Tax=Fodinicola acaciae TaxID=2681555 RepID=UPI0013D2B31B|nr:FAD-dependent monooxygenase [Fodinicola acaciae]